MKRKRIIGVVFIIASLLLQMSYAMNVEIGSKVVGSTQYDVGFKQVTIDLEGNENYITVEQDIHDKSNVLFEVSNLYPGSGFILKPTIRNYGTSAVDIKSLKVEGVDKQTSPLLEKLRGYKGSDALTIGEYNTYLTNEVANKRLAAGEEKTFELRLGLAKDEKELKGEKTAFKLTLVFEQNDQSPVRPGSSPSSSSSSSPSSPAPSAVVPDEPVPGGGVVPEQPVIEPSKPVDTITEPDEPIPGNPVATPQAQPTSGKLPKTGGIARGIVYSVGILLLIIGIVFCMKKNEK